MVTLQDILEAYFDCRRSKRTKDSSLAFELDYEMECAKLVEEINNRTYEPGPSIAFVVTRPKYREVFAASFRDRIIHHWIALRLEPLFEQSFIEDTYNCRKGKGTLYGRERLAEKMKVMSNNYTEDCYVAKFDMQGFFMSINKPLLWQLLEEYIFRNYTNAKDFNDLLWLSKKIILHCPEKNCIKKCPSKLWSFISPDKSLFTCGADYGLPIGNLTSQMFANFYLLMFDLMMVAIFGIGYGRYVDDFFVVCKDKKKILSFIVFMREWLLKERQIKLHPNKVYLQHVRRGISFIGGTIKDGRHYTNNRTIDNFGGLIKGLNAYIGCTEPETAVCRINSYLGFLHHTNSFNIRKKMVISLSKDWWEKLYANKGFKKMTVKRRYRNRQNIINNIKGEDYGKIVL